MLARHEQTMIWPLRIRLWRQPAPLEPYRQAHIDTRALLVCNRQNLFSSLREAAVSSTCRANLVMTSASQMTPRRPWLTPLSSQHIYRLHGQWQLRKIVMISGVFRPFPATSPQNKFPNHSYRPICKSDGHRLICRWTQVCAPTIGAHIVGVDSTIPC